MLTNFNSQPGTMAPEGASITPSMTALPDWAWRRLLIPEKVRSKTENKARIVSFIFSLSGPPGRQVMLRGGGKIRALKFTGHLRTDYVPTGEASSATGQEQ